MADERTNFQSSLCASFSQKANYLYKSPSSQAESVQGVNCTWEANSGKETEGRRAIIDENLS